MPIFRKPNFKLPSLKITEKVSTPKGSGLDFLKPKPVFNRPVSLRRKPGPVPQPVFIAFLSTLIAISATVTGLKAATIHFIEDNHDRGFLFTFPDGKQTVLAALPEDLYNGTAKLALISAVISTILAIAHLAFLLRWVKKPRRTQSYIARRNVLFLHFLNMVLILLSMVALFVTHKSSSHFSVRYMSRKGGFGEDGFYDFGTFDLETWSCELTSIQGAKVAWDDYESQCKIELTGRMMMIPFLLVGIAVMCLAIFQMMGCSREAEQQQIKTADIEEFEMGKFNAI